MLCTFDLPICRVALRFTIGHNKIEIHYLDASGIPAQFVVPHESRVQKYAARRLRDVPLKVPRLGLSIIFDHITRLMYC